MAKLILVLVAVAIVGVFAEPPSPRRYLPPGQGQGGYARGGQQPSSRYGAPSSSNRYSNGASNRNNSPSSRYGAPSSQYGAPSSQYGAPSSQYGAPSSQYGAPSSQYGAPSSQYSAPSSQYGAPSSQYGAPSSQYGAPSSQYGAPSSQYGAPSNGNGGFSGYGRGGYNNQEDPLAEPANYEFSYEVKDDESGNDFGHQESRQGDEARGSYHVVLPDGRKQIVDYVANNEGYMPTIRYEEGQGGYPSGPNGGQGPY